MSSSRVTSASFATESSHALAILSRWAARIAERRHLSTQESDPPEVLIQKTRTRQRVARERVFRRHLPFSWMRFFAGVVSLLLVFSDVFRGGAGVKSLQKAYPAIQPDQVLGFGTTWHYSVFSATKDEAANKTALVWTYKFDSTSISWRAFARHFDVKAFPDCFYYVETCENELITGIHAFGMIDSLVTAISGGNSTAQEPVSHMLRTENEYIDRLHQFLLPKLFKNVNWRTNQALYYSAALLMRSNARSICFPAIGSKMRAPRFCKRIWVNLKRSCAPSDTQGKAVGLLYVHTMQRLYDIQTRFPDLSVDLTFLESQEDMQVNRGGLSSLGFERSDVATIIRARNCRVFPCETVFIDEYRYETGLLTSDVIQWYHLVATLRVIGQLYFWLRGIGLMLSCYFVFKNPTEGKSSTWVQLRKARHLFVKTPTQSVVYGSPFPIFCYVVAHFLDAPYTYQVLESHFFSQAGVVDIKLESFVSYAVVQMRSVWVYALIWQLIVILTRFCNKTHTNRLNSGLVGVPEFLLSIFSYVTLLAQYRMTSIRSAKVLTIMEFPSNTGPAWEAVKYMDTFSHRGRGNTLLGGVIIDLKFLICLGFFVAAWWAVYTVRVRLWAIWRNEGKHGYSHWYLLPPTPVPYSAGILWPSVCMCVHWTSDFYCIQDNRNEEPELLHIVKKKRYRTRHPCVARMFWWRTGDARVLALNSIQAKYLPDAELRQRPKRFTNTYRYIQHQMECLHSRSDGVEANVAFINAVLLSDPLVYFRVVYGGEKLAYYQSIWFTRQVVLLPVAVVGEHNEYTSGLRLLRLVHISELSWAELVQCG